MADGVPESDDIEANPNAGFWSLGEGLKAGTNVADFHGTVTEINVVRTEHAGRISKFLDWVKNVCALPEGEITIDGKVIKKPLTLAEHYAECFYFPWGEQVMKNILAMYKNDEFVVRAFLLSAMSEVDKGCTLPEWVIVWMTKQFKKDKAFFVEVYEDILKNGSNFEIVFWNMMKDEVGK